MVSTHPWPGRLAAAFFLVFAAFQLALSLGAPFGEMAWGGSARVLPEAIRWHSTAAAVILVVAAGVMLVRAGDVGRKLHQQLFWWLNAALVVQLALNTLANLVSHSAGERMVMAPASALGCALCVWALFTRRR